MDARINRRTPTNIVMVSGRLGLAQAIEHAA
jgi:hypothetical protein